MLAVSISMTARNTAKGTSPPRPALLASVDGVELVRHADGSREVRRTDRPLDSLAAAFEAIAAIYSA
jgi:hypothetical protein